MCGCLSAVNLATQFSNLIYRGIFFLSLNELNLKDEVGALLRAKEVVQGPGRSETWKLQDTHNNFPKFELKEDYYMGYFIFCFYFPSCSLR